MTDAELSILTAWTEGHEVVVDVGPLNGKRSASLLAGMPPGPASVLYAVDPEATPQERWSWGLAVSNVKGDRSAYLFEEPLTQWYSVPCDLLFLASQKSPHPFRVRYDGWVCGVGAISEDMRGKEIILGPGNLWRSRIVR